MVPVWRRWKVSDPAYSAVVMTVDVLPTNVSTAVATTIETYLARLDAHVPELVAGVWLTGSVALGDVHPGRSDVDVVTVLTEQPDRDALRALADVHESLPEPQPSDGPWDRTRPRLDGWYVTREDLRRPPTRGQTLGLRALDRRLLTGPGWLPPALLWHEVAEHGLAVAGLRPDQLTIARDPDGVVDWCRHTLANQWGPWWDRTARSLSLAGFGGLGPLAPTTGVLGVARIRYTLETGGIISKCGGGEWALEAMAPRWRRILTEALRVRNHPDRPSLYRSPWRRRRDALAFVDSVLTDAERWA